MKQTERCRLSAVAQRAAQGPEALSATDDARSSPRPAPVAIRITFARSIPVQQALKYQRPNELNTMQKGTKIGECGF
jgi:hypothetical protein